MRHTGRRWGIPANPLPPCAPCAPPGGDGVGPHRRNRTVGVPANEEPSEGEGQLGHAVGGSGPTGGLQGRRWGTAPTVLPAPP